MEYSNNLILSAASVSRRSLDHSRNMEALASGLPYYSAGRSFVDCHELGFDGRIPDAVADALLVSFDVRPKMKKFFDRPSVLAFACVRNFSEFFGAAGSEVSLFACTGPANARLRDFSEWAESAGEEPSEPYPPMMASSVVKLLPNVVMANLAVNFGLRGENSIFSPSCVSSARALGAAARSVESGGSPLSAAVSVSCPFEYFNIDSYKRFFGESFFDPPLCECASAVLLASRDFVSSRPALRERVIGAVTGLDHFRLETAPFSGGEYEHLAALSAVRENVLSNFPGREFVFFAPSASGNFLSASEPLGALAAVHRLNSLASSRPASSASFDRFGNVSVVTVAGRLASGF